MLRSLVVARWSRSSISGRRRAARASSVWRVIEQKPLRTPHNMADALRAVALGRRCWVLLLQRTRSPQTSASLAAASAGAASPRQMNSSSSCPAVCWGGLALSLSPQKTCLLRGTFRFPGRAEKRKVVPSVSLPSLPPVSILFIRQALHAPHTAACRVLRVWRRLWHGSIYRRCWG